MRSGSTPLACTTAAIGNTTSGRDHALDRSREHLRERDEPDRARRLDAVLDLAREAELGRERERDGLDSLEHDRDRDDPRHEHGREVRLRRPGFARRRSGRSSGRRTGTRTRAGTAGSACARRTRRSSCAGPRGRAGSAPAARVRLASSAERGRVACLDAAPAHLTRGEPCQSADEHVLEARLADREVEELEARPPRQPPRCGARAARCPRRAARARRP